MQAPALGIMASTGATPQFSYRNVVVAGDVVTCGDTVYAIRDLHAAQFEAYRTGGWWWFAIAGVTFAVLLFLAFFSIFWENAWRNMTLLSSAAVLFGAASLIVLYKNFGYTAYIALSPKAQDAQPEHVDLFFAPFATTAKRFCELINTKIEDQRAMQKLASAVRLGGYAVLADALEARLAAVERGELSLTGFQQFTRACIDELRREK
jgi:hypothetical protein